MERGHLTVTSRRCLEELTEAEGSRAAAPADITAQCCEPRLADMTVASRWFRLFLLLCCLQTGVSQSDGEFHLPP